MWGLTFSPMDTPPEVMMTSARLIPSCSADSRSSGLHTQTRLRLLASLNPNGHSEGILLVSNDAEVDGGVPVLLDGSQKSGAVRVSDLPRMEIILRIQQLKTNTMNPKGAQKCLSAIASLSALVPRFRWT